MANTIGVEVVEWIFDHYRGLLKEPNRAGSPTYRPAIINAGRDTRQQLEQEIDAIVRRRTVVLADAPGAKHS